jgi:hypothetical protein
MAAKVGIGQPPLSQQIRDLEGEVGAALFHRLAHGAELTEADKVLSAGESAGSSSKSGIDCLTEETGGRPLRDDIPISLPQSFKDEAQRLRNQLLLYRFRNLKAGRHSEAPDRGIEPRLNQIFLPLLSVVSDAKDREELRALARRYHGEMVNERGMDLEAQILEVIRDLRESGRPLTIKDITNWLVDRHGDEYERKLTTKWIGNVIRRKLQLRPVRASSGYVIPPEELPKVDRLYERYGIPSGTGDAEPTAATPEPDFP